MYLFTFYRLCLFCCSLPLFSSSCLSRLIIRLRDRRIVRYSLEENEGATEFFELPIPEKGEAAAAPSDSPFVIYSRNGVIIATAFGSEVSIFQWGGEADNERGYSLFGDGDVGSHWNDALKEGRFSDEARVTASAAFMVERPLWVLGHEDGAIELHSIPQGTRLCRVHADGTSSIPYRTMQISFYLPCCAASPSFVLCYFMSVVLFVVLTVFFERVVVLFCFEFIVLIMIQRLMD